MFKLGLKSYLKNLPHLFTILGVIAFFVILAFCIAVPYMIETTKTLGNELSKALEGAGTKKSVDLIINDFANTIRGLDWNNPADALRKLLDPNWLLDTLKICIGEDMGAKWETLKNTFINSFTVFTAKTIAAILLIVILFLIGIGASVIITKIAIDLHMKSNNNPIRYVISFIIDVVLFVGIWFLFIYCLIKTKVAFYFLLIGVFALMIMLYPFQNTIVYGRGKVKLKDVFTFKNISGLVLSTIIGFGLSFLISFLCYQYFSKAFALIIAAPLFILTYLVCENASKNYVCEQFYDKKIEEKAIKKYKSSENNEQ